MTSLLVLSLTLISTAQAFENIEFKGKIAAVRESDIEGRVGESIRLPCEVDKATCGQFHSIKWYKGNDRVYIFSEIAKITRSEGSLLERSNLYYTVDENESWLEILPLRTEDEGKYKCELTYLTVKESCSVVQLVNLRTLARPTSFSLTLSDGSLVQNGTKVGPFLEGDDLSLNCEAGGAKPVPSVKWINGTRRIHGRFQSTVDQDGLFIGSHPIDISLTRYDHGMKLACEIFNDAMFEPMLLWVEVDVDVSPSSVVIDIERRVIREGDMVTMRCIARGAKPPADVRWTNGTTPITQSSTRQNIQNETVEYFDYENDLNSSIVEDNTVREMGDGTFETESLLQFRGTRYENGISFNCRVNNEVLERRRASPIEKSIKLDVQYPPTVNVHPEERTLNESMSFTVHCQYDANPRELTHVDWFLNGRRLTIEERVEKYKNGNVRYPSLFVKNASADDMGNYTCRVKNKIGTSSVTNAAYISVQFPPEVAVVMIPEGPFSEEDRPNVTLICDIVRAHPDSLSRVRWFLDGDLLKDSDIDDYYDSEFNLTVTVGGELPECEGNGTFNDNDSEFCGVDPSRLLLENVFREFHGNYSCEGMNAAGWGPPSNIAPVIVYYPPGKAHISYLPDMIIKDNPVNFTCNVDDLGRPEATTFRWTRNSHLLKDVTSQVWQVDSASLETEANLTCQPYNSEGEGTLASVSVEVYAKPFFITRLPTYHGALMNADEVSLTCRVECSPMCSISWLKDNLPLDNRTHYQVKNNELPPSPESGDLQSVMSTLSWKMSQWTDSELHRERDNANYTCISSPNIAGPGVSSHTRFWVEYPPEEISISQKVVQVVENNTIPSRVECTANSYPEPSYYWLHKEEQVYAGSQLKLDFKIGRDKAGDYTCVAENKHGKVTADTYLDVLFKPECAISRQDTQDGEVAKIILVCRAFANPEDVSFRWQLKNETLSEDMESSGLISRLTLQTIPETVETYQCYVNNSVGESKPCEIDVTGVAGLIETLGDDNLLLYALIAGAILIAIIIIIILIIFCRRQRQRGKYSGGPTLHNTKEEGSTNRRLSLSQTATTLPQSNALQPSHKWPHRPGVQVHVNSLTSLADDSKTLYNIHPSLNTNTNSTTISSGSYQVHQLQHHHQLDNQTSLLSNNNNSSQFHPKLNTLLSLQRPNFSTLENKRSSSSSSSASSSSNLIHSRNSAIHTLPRHSPLDALSDVPEIIKQTKRHIGKRGSKHTLSESTKPSKLSSKSADILPAQRPKSVLSEISSNNSGSSDSEQNKKGNVPKSGTTPAKEASNGTKENHPSSPDEEGPTFYENLPFHGIQSPPNKPLLTGSDLDYADVDSTTYAYGPIPYKAESLSAAQEKKAEREAERTGVPARPPRKK